MVQEGNELAAIDDIQLAIGVGDGVGGSLATVKQRDLAEYLAGADQIEDRVAAFGGRGADLHGAADHRIKAVAGITLGKYRDASLQMRVLDVTTKLIEGIGLEV